MTGNYRCPNCGREYTVAFEGDYICECGVCFHFPAAAPVGSANYALTVPGYLDSSSRSVRRHMRYARNSNVGRMKKMPALVDCPLGKASLICAFLSLPFFGIPAIPGLILGFAARIMISNPKYRYKGDGIAVAGIITSIISLSLWAVLLMLHS